MLSLPLNLPVPYHPLRIIAPLPCLYRAFRLCAVIWLLLTSPPIWCCWSLPHSKLLSLTSFFHLQELLLAPPLPSNPSTYGYWFLEQATPTPLLPSWHLLIFQVIILQGLVMFTCSVLSKHLVLNLHGEPNEGRYSVCFLAFYFQDLT